MDNIVICGFMGCGKSTVGKCLAKKTGRRFVDMDDYIEKKAGMTVAKIFEKYGEQGFRDLEHEACVELAAESGLIIASGGGALTFERNTQTFRGKDIVILLDVPQKVIRERLKNDTKRPLLQRPDKDRVMEELYNKRLPYYRKAADITIPGQDSPLKTASEIINALKQRRLSISL